MASIATDTYTRSGELSGTTTDTGSLTYSGTTGAYATDGNVMYAAGGATEISLDPGVNSYRLTMDVTMTTASGNNAQIFKARALDSNNWIGVWMRIDTTGPNFSSFNIHERDGGVFGEETEHELTGGLAFSSGINMTIIITPTTLTAYPTADPAQVLTRAVPAGLSGVTTVGWIADIVRAGAAVTNFDNLSIEEYGTGVPIFMGHYMNMMRG